MLASKLVAYLQAMLRYTAVLILFFTHFFRWNKDRILPTTAFWQISCKFGQVVHSPSVLLHTKNSGEAPSPHIKSYRFNKNRHHVFSI
ncbi:hypothetical protein VN97_g2832 [Penicillium thymicola]|uniref:Uncharacterized protein n=1 Tax=Penicillium thymicola TaxID=293382 RepID=A0AAI9TNV6_PENTH|nr:hypothetical protein VN97_g2832 [Penicillium thymicola]